MPYAANIFALKKLGAHAVIATCAVGSLRGSIRPGELVIVDQFIDKTFRRQSSFFNGYGAVHTEMAQPTCGRLGRIIAEAARKLAVRTHRKGTYVGMEGPKFSTRAESLMHRIMGRGFDRDDGDAGGEIGQRGTDVLFAGRAGERLRLLEAAEEEEGQAGAVAGDNREPESGKR